MREYFVYLYKYINKHDEITLFKLDHDFYYLNVYSQLKRTLKIIQT